MINSYFRSFIEGKVNNICIKIADAIHTDQLLEPLRTHVAIYKPLEVDPDWIVSTGLCLDESAVNSFIIGDLSAWTLEVQCRHKTNPEYFLDLTVNSQFSNSGIWTSDSKHKCDVANMSTHLDFEAMKAFVAKLDTAVVGIKFDAGTVLFTKVNEEAVK